VTICDKGTQPVRNSLFKRDKKETPKNSNVSIIKGSSAYIKGDKKGEINPLAVCRSVSNLEAKKLKRTVR
jgi:hypothetical protein